MEIPRHWRLRKQRYLLQGEVCPHCDTKIFPPRDLCPECGGIVMALYRLLEYPRPQTPQKNLRADRVTKY